LGAATQDAARRQQLRADENAHLPVGGNQKDLGHGYIIALSERLFKLYRLKLSWEEDDGRRPTEERRRTFEGYPKAAKARGDLSGSLLWTTMAAADQEGS
jgi:hypothetical protein